MSAIAPRASAAEAPAYPSLVADVGGTNARFGWLAQAGAAVTDVQVLPVREHRSPLSAVQAYLALQQARLGAAYQAPRRLAFALATSVGGDRLELTNAHWSFSRSELQAQLGLSSLLVLNDFEALALSLPRLSAAQLRQWGGVRVLPGEDLGAAGALAVIGPGTGLGVAGVLPSRHGWMALPGEGGHMTLAPADGFESALLAQVRTEFAHVSAERLLSGIGLPVLHQAVRAVLAAPLAEALSTELIVERGLTGADAFCERSLATFCALLGGFAGNVALALGARGGVYIGGGIVPRLGDYFFASQFRERFEAKGRFRAYLEEIPVALITDTLAALSGAALALEQQDAICL